MNLYVKDKIAECIKKKQSSLNLSGLGDNKIHFKGNEKALLQSLSRMPFLKKFNLSFVSSLISLEFLNAVPNLLELNIEYTPLLESYAPLQSLKKIRILNMSRITGNVINDFSKPEEHKSEIERYMSYIEQLPSLTKLDLAWNNIQHFNFEKLQSYNSIKELELYGNPIESIKGIEKLENLQLLYVKTAHAQESIEPISKLQHLKALVITGNHSNTGVEHLGKCKNLQSLLLSNVPSREIPREFCDLEKLIELRFEGTSMLRNKKNCWLVDIENIKALKNIEYLDLGSNNIKDFSPLLDLKKLKKLCIRQNPGADKFPEKFHSGLWIAHTYKVNGNVIQSVDEIKSYIK